MADVQVTCITKRNPAARYEGITHLGGSGWWWTVAQVIQSIEARTNTFYTSVNGVRANVEVVQGPTGKYVRTHRDGRPTDNLLELSLCR
jgi:hypothetical protein